MSLPVSILPQATAAGLAANTAAPTPARGSLAHLFCDDHDYGNDEFAPAVMRTCMARRALPLYALFGGADFFAADRELVENVADARTMEEVEAAIDDYWMNPANRPRLRRMVGLRLSTLRLRRFAAGYLPSKSPRRAQLRQQAVA